MNKLIDSFFDVSENTDSLIDTTNTLNGKPILYYTLQTLQDCGLVPEIILVVPEKEYDNACSDWLGKPSVTFVLQHQVFRVLEFYFSYLAGIFC